MLDATPVRVALGANEVAAAIDACLSAAQASTACADACLNEEDIEAMRVCIALDQDCADVCATTATLLSRPGRADHRVVHRLLQACVHACASSAEECERHAEHHRHCAICARVTRACEVSCKALLDAEAFEELQKLAGG